MSEVSLAHLGCAWLEIRVSVPSSVPTEEGLQNSVVVQPGVLDVCALPLGASVPSGWSLERCLGTVGHWEAQRSRSD